MIGFGRDFRSGTPKDAIDRMFSPEFRNRLSGVIEFAQLTPSVMERVVDKFIGELGERLAAQKVDLSITDRRRKWLAEHGYDPRFGARPMARLIENEIARVLADESSSGVSPRRHRGGRRRGRQAHVLVSQREGGCPRRVISRARSSVLGISEVFEHLAHGFLGPLEMKPVADTLENLDLGALDLSA